jgi:predicted nucleotide-binding protein (sugar kinase/HSP70/actin superfamily)
MAARRAGAMRVGLPRELLSMERITLFKEAVDGLAPGFQWVHDPRGKGPEPIFLDGDACLPFKKMVRTSLSLLKDTDALILPRIAQLDGYLMCPNFRALPDIVNINRSKMGMNGKSSLIAPLMEDGGRGPLTDVAGETLRLLHVTSPAPVPGTTPAITETGSIHMEDDLSRTIALIGHPYVLMDPRLNSGVPELLAKAGFDTRVPGDVPFTELDQLAEDRDYYAKKLYWRPGREILGAFLYFLNKKRPAGIIQLVAFNCGVEALLRIELMSIYKRMGSPLPYMVLVCDEHTQRDHVVTRVEAFLDIIDGIRII